VGRYVVGEGAKKNAYKILVSKPEENGPPRSRWEDNNKGSLFKKGNELSCYINNGNFFTI
jgi:hypothetical protein